MTQILVVDDDPQLRRLTARVLQRAGFQVSVAEDGSSALAMLNGSRFELLVTDILMPNQDGIGTIIQVKRDHPKLKVIAISGSGDTVGMNYLDFAKKLGSDAVLRKPFEFDDLVSTVKQLLGLVDQESLSA